MFNLVVTGVTVFEREGHMDQVSFELNTFTTIKPNPKNTADHVLCFQAAGCAEQWLEDQLPQVQEYRYVFQPAYGSVKEPVDEVRTISRPSLVKPPEEIKFIKEPYSGLGGIV